MELEVTELRLHLGRPLSPAEATHLRGYFGTAFADDDRLHNHLADGSLRYDYPRVLFQVVGRAARVLGLADGGAAVERLWREADQARLGNEELPVLESTLLRRREPFGECGGPRDYRFANPWFGLNQENHRRYDMAGTDAERHGLLGRVLVGNCLSLAKAFGHRVTARLTADATRLRPTAARLKGVPMRAFVGSFSVNFTLPTGVGLGKSVSRGFGTVEALGEHQGGGPC